MTNDLCLQFSREAIKFYKQYIYIKEDVFRKEKLLGIACEILTKQENIITELRGFVISTIAPMMELIEREKDGIVWKYKDLTKQQVPDYKLNDPFHLFDLYCSQATEPPKKDIELTDALDKLYFRDKYIQDLEAEIQIVHSGTEYLLKEGMNNNEKILEQGKLIEKLEKELDKER